MQEFDFNAKAAFVYDLEHEEKLQYVCLKDPLACSLRGDGGYYIFRFDDFMSRHVDCSHEPPVYYYGPLENEYQIKAYIEKIENKDYSLLPPIPGSIPPALHTVLVNIYIAAYNISNLRELWLGLEQELVKRQKDVEPTIKGIPNISKSYGYKYCVAFGELLYPKLSAIGQKWIKDTLQFLQDYMEKGIINKAWTSKKNKYFNKRYKLNDSEARHKFYSDLELSSTKFKDFAFATHPDAYLDAGLTRLPLLDLIRITITPDFAEWKELDTIEQAWIVLKDMVRDRIHPGAGRALDTLEDIVRKFKELPIF